MCIIVHKTKKASIPSKKTLKNCFEINSDGAGFMFASDNKVHIVKGLMTFNEFYDTLKDYKKKYNNFKNMDLVLHFRIGTQGGNVPQNTHPFPVSNKIQDLKALKTTCKIGIAHNGILSDYNYNKKLSDTQLFVKDYLFKLFELKSNINDKFIQKLISNELDTSKLCILNNKGNVVRLGSWCEDKGVYYSNLTYKTSYYTSDVIEYTHNNYKYNDSYSYNYGYSYLYDTLDYNDKKDVLDFYDIVYSSEFVEVSRPHTAITLDNIELSSDDNNNYMIDSNYNVYEISYSLQDSKYLGVAYDMYDTKTLDDITFKDLQEYNKQVYYELGG